MHHLKLNNHKQLQYTASRLASIYVHEDPDVLHCALVEVLQNTVQHSDGNCALFLTKTSILIANVVKKGQFKGYQIGLKLFTGIKTKRLGELFISEIEPSELRMQALDIDALIENINL